MDDAKPAKTRKRRGPYRRLSRLVGVAPEEAAAVARAEVERRRALYYEASKLTDLGARDSAATALAQGELYLQRLHEMSARGQLNSDEARTIPSLMRELRHHRCELGLSGNPESLAKPEEEDL